MNYKGPIAIVFNDENSNNYVTSREDTLSYYIKSKPCFHTIRNDMPDEGMYKVNFFYYSRDTLIHLKSQGDSRQVVDRGIISITKGHRKIVFASIYVSDSIRPVNSLYKEMEEQPDICW